MTNSDFLYVGKPSWKAVLCAYLFNPIVLLLTIASMGHLLFLTVPLMLLYRFGYEYRIDGFDVKIRKGVFSQSSIRIPTYAIKTVDHQQGFIQRFFNVGEIVILDTSGNKHVIWGVENVSDVADSFSDHITKYKTTSNNVRVLTS